MSAKKINIKNTVDDIGSDFAVLDAPCDECFGKPKSTKKSKVLK
jgi:hypothetical protein